MTNVERTKIMEVLMLAVDNQRTSASRAGLKHRGGNLDKMTDTLVGLLDLSEEDLENEYSDYLDREAE